MVWQAGTPSFLNFTNPSFLYSEIDHLITVGPTHVFSDLFGIQSPCPEWKPRTHEIFMGEWFLDPLLVFIPKFCRIAIFIKNFEPFVHIFNIIRSFFTLCNDDVDSGEFRRTNNFQFFCSIWHCFTYRIGRIMNLPPLIIILPVDDLNVFTSTAMDGTNPILEIHSTMGYCTFLVSPEAEN